MENVRTIVNEHCNIIQQIIREEDEHWKEIHAVMNQYVFRFLLFFCLVFFFNFYI
jgi:hypothetical protein